MEATNKMIFLRQTRPAPGQPGIEDEIQRRLAAERTKLESQAGLATPKVAHFHRPIERAFTAAERDKVTILYGGLTWKHEKLMGAAFEASGYRCRAVPTPAVSGFQLGKEFGNNGQCNPTYFTVGNLVEYLQHLESQGLSRQHIIDHYVFFTAGSCGPCRFGMYESEYRYALRNAGFGGFRVLLFQSDGGVKQESGEAGMKFTVDLGMSMLRAVTVGDALHDLIHQAKPFEVHEGDTERIFTEATDQLCHRLLNHRPYEILERTPPWLSTRLAAKDGLQRQLNSFGKLGDHFFGRDYADAVRECRDRLNTLEVDRTRVRPVVKITGEFWAQTTEGDGNFNMFAFLEQEGAQVMVEPIGTWIMYLAHQAGVNARRRKAIDAPHFRPAWWQVRKRLANELRFLGKSMLFAMGEGIYTWQYHRAGRALGGVAHHLIPQAELSRLAAPFYDPLARGGEGHLEVGKNVYYTVNKLCHMVLSLKPFGCMPSNQSDGVQSAVINHYKDMIFLPIETSGEGEVNAHSRVQMALGEARAKARAEFQQALDSTGKRLEDIKAYTAEHPQLRRFLYRVPQRKGIAGTAANFVLHVSDLMDGRVRLPREAKRESIEPRQAAVA